MTERIKEKKVCILGSGNGGSALAKIISANCAKLSSFEEEVTMYVYEEEVDGRRLTDIINETHENVKYLPGRSLGKVVAVSDMEVAVRDADVIVFTFPHRQIPTVCAALLGKIKPTAVGLVMIKGFDLAENGSLEPASRLISVLARIPTCVITGLVFPGELVAGKKGEATIACRSKTTSAMLKELIQSEHLHVVPVEDVEAVELLATLKSLVGCAAGVVDGLRQGYNCKAAIFRMGLIEMVKFLDMFYPHVRLSTVLESTIVAEVLLACFCGRERRMVEALVTRRMSLPTAERELLNGLRLGGARVARDIRGFLRLRDVEGMFPLFNAVYDIFTGDLEAEDFLECIKSHPEHILRLQRLPW